MRGYPGRSNTLDEDFRADMDNAVSIERRLAAMKAFHDAGVRTTCFISPIFPGLTDLPSIIHRAKNQCNLVWLENLNLRGGYKKTIFDYITEKHPDLLPLYDTIYNKKNAIFVAGASVFGVFAAGCNFSHLKGEELTVIHLSTQQQKGEKHLWTLLPFTGVFTCAFWGHYPCPPGRGGGARQPWTALRRCGSGRGPWRQRHADR